MHGGGLNLQNSITNPVDDPHAMHCSAFARYCYEEAGADFLGRKASILNTTPEHIAQAGTKVGKLIRYKPYCESQA